MREVLKGALLLVLRNTPVRSMSKYTEPSRLIDAFNPHRSQWCEDGGSPGLESSTK